MPGVRRCVLSKAIWTLEGELPFHIMAEFYFPSLEALQTAVGGDVVHALFEQIGRDAVSVVCMEEAIVLDGQAAEVEPEALRQFEW